MRLTVTKRSGHCTELPQEAIAELEVRRLWVANAGTEGVLLDLVAGTLQLPIYHHIRPFTPGGREQRLGEWEVVGPGC